MPAPSSPSAAARDGAGAQRQINNLLYQMEQVISTGKVDSQRALFLVEIRAAGCYNISAFDGRNEAPWQNGFFF
jgi:hypothetical protein